MRRTVDYYFAPQSPWMYLGHERFAELLQRTGTQVRVLPVDFGKVFPVSGGLPLPQRAPQRQAYRLVELARFRDHLGLPLNLQPRFFPVAVDDAITVAGLNFPNRVGLAAGLDKNGEALRESGDGERVREARDEQKLSNRSGNIDDVVIQRGAWWAEGHSGEPLVAMEDREADQLGLKVGDRLPPDGMYDRVISEVERPLLSLALGATRGNQLRAARLLGLNRNTLRKKIKDLDVPVVRTPQVRRGG